MSIISRVDLSCRSHELVQRSASASVFNYTLEFGDDVSPRVINRTQHWLRALSSNDDSSLPVRVVLGTAAQDVIQDEELHALGSEAYVIRARCTAGQPLVLAVRGNARNGTIGRLDAAPLLPRKPGRQDIRIGNAFGVYALLAHLGVAFLHPLEPHIASNINLDAEGLCRLNETSKPGWGSRIWHYHTMHPVELSEVFNGLTLTLTLTFTLIGGLQRVRQQAFESKLGIDAAGGGFVLRVVRGQFPERSGMGPTGIG